MKTLVTAFAILAIGALLAGCILPAPHFNRLSDRVEGRVVDAKTKLPVKDAQIILERLPETNTRTDREGRFVLKSAHAFSPVVFILGHGGVSSPHQGHYEPELLIVHGAYQERHINARSLAVSPQPDSDAWVLPDIELVPK